MNVFFVGRCLCEIIGQLRIRNSSENGSELFLKCASAGLVLGVGRKGKARFTAFLEKAKSGSKISVRTKQPVVAVCIAGDSVCEINCALFSFIYLTGP